MGEALVGREIVAEHATVGAFVHIAFDRAVHGLLQMFLKRLSPRRLRSIAKIESNTTRLTKSTTISTANQSRTYQRRSCLAMKSVTMLTQRRCELLGADRRIAILEDSHEAEEVGRSPNLP